MHFFILDQCLKAVGSLAVSAEAIRGLTEYYIRQKLIIEP